VSERPSSPPGHRSERAVESLVVALRAVLDQAEPMLPLGEACAMVACSPIKLRTLLATGELPALKIGKEWVIPRRAFVDRLNELAVSERETREAETALANRPRSPMPGPAYDFGVGVPVGMAKGKRGRPRLPIA
jgi:hypothetical protein